MLSSKVRDESIQKRRSTLAVRVRRHRGLFWTLHSLWALATGGFVIFLAHESYSVVPWIFAMLGLTWLSTFFFCRMDDSPVAPTFVRLGGGFLSYLNRVMYQETLFFLIPFYAYSTTLRPVPEWSALFLAVVVALAVVSCLDMLFDRWVRHSIAFTLSFFALVAFSALNLLLPIVFRIDLDRAADWAGAIATTSALALSLSGPKYPARERVLAVFLVAGLGLGLSASARWWVPPVPLRVQEISFARDVNRSPLFEVGEIVGDEVSQTELEDRLTAWFRVFSPTRLIADVQIRWELDGVPIRESREVTIEGHRDGFRVWDGLVFEDGVVPEGRYVVSLFAEGRPLARKEIRVVGRLTHARRATHARLGTRVDRAIGAPLRQPPPGV